MRLLLALLVLSGALNSSEAIYADISSKIDASAPTPVVLLQVARSLEGTPYVASSIEQSPEQLRVHLDRTDCILFVEACVAFVMDARSPAPSFENYCECIRSLRYRGGRVEGYGSRIHYTSEWIAQAQARGLLREYTFECGVPFRQDFNYMTLHPERYPAMDAASAALVENAQGNLQARNPYFKVPHEDISGVLPLIQEGDIIAFTSRVPGLDIAHVAIACKGEDGRMHFIHASSKYKKVLLEPSALEDYPSDGLRLIRLLI